MSRASNAVKPDHSRHGFAAHRGNCPCWGQRRVKVARVIDGDTVQLSNEEEVRLMGVDMPEPKHPQTPVQPFGKEASAFTKQLAEGKEVRLEFDVQWRDTYRRLLAYVYIRDTIPNAELGRQGSAQVATFPPKVKDQELFLKLQREAREAKRALWKQ